MPMGDFGSIDYLYRALVRSHIWGQSSRYLSTEGYADRLMTEADTEDWERMETQQLESETDVLRDG